MFTSFKKKLFYIICFLFICWVSNQLLYTTDTSYNNPNNSFFGAIAEIIINLLLLLKAIILIIPSLIGSLLYNIFFTKTIEFGDKIPYNPKIILFFLFSSVLWIIIKIIQPKKVLFLNKKEPKQNAEEESNRFDEEFKNIKKYSLEFETYWKNINSLILSTDSWNLITYYNDLFKSFVALKENYRINKDISNYLSMLFNLLERLRDLEILAKDAGEKHGNYSSTKEVGEDDDPYNILNVTRDMSNEEITKNYNDIIKKYHPDKVDSLGEEFKILANKKSKLINDAYDKIKKEREMR